MDNLFNINRQGEHHFFIVSPNLYEIIEVITSSRKGHGEESSAPKQSIPEEDPNVSYQSRLQILQELGDIGLNTSNFDSLPIDVLRNMLTNIHGLLRANRSVDGRLRSGDSVPFLSNSDKKMIECLLTTDGFVTSKDLSEKLSIPLSTIQRRRKRLEAIFIVDWNLTSSPP
jgi:uncharacterized membrane protein